jgi:hypothetical protein
MDQPARASHVAVASHILMHAAAVTFLTILTQIGGLVWLVALVLRRFLPAGRRAVAALPATTTTSTFSSVDG